jgi:YesN/AraC family two-component response regulator
VKTPSAIIQGHDHKGGNVTKILIFPDQALVLEKIKLAVQLLAQCSRDRTRAITRNIPPFVMAAREIIHEHYCERSSLSGIARLVDIHPVYLATEFRRCYQCSVGDYIRRLRIDAACRELDKLSSSKSLAEIGVEIGFSHHAHFTRTFKQHIGPTPFRISTTHTD